MLGADGKPVWYQDSTGKRRPRRSWGAGTEPHPLAHTVPSYTARDLADIIAITHPHRAVAAFRQLHDDSIIELVEGVSGIFGRDGAVSGVLRGRSWPGVVGLGW